MSWYTPLRDASWFGPGRARAYAWLIAFTMALGLIYGWASLLAGHRLGFPAPPGPYKPGATDFVAFWVAGRMALHGHIADVYNLNVLSQAENAAVDMPPGALLAFFYPPTSFSSVCLVFMLNISFAMMIPDLLCGDDDV